MTIRLAVAGDTMLGRGVAERLQTLGPDKLFAPEVRDTLAGADLCLLNLECCVSDRGAPWPRPGKPFFFRAPPVAAATLAELGVDCACLANNHALDFGAEALLDTSEHLAAAGIRPVGAGADEAQARAPVVMEAAGYRVAVVAVTDHPDDFAAGPQRPGVAYADLAAGVPQWLADLLRRAGQETDILLVTAHWGPNMTTEPMRYVQAAARSLRELGVTLVVGHSAHVFHGVGPGVLYDLGDLINDYVVDPRLRNDLGIIGVVTIDQGGARKLEVVPVKLDFAFTRLVDPAEYQWVRHRFTAACAALGTSVVDEGDKLAITF